MDERCKNCGGELIIVPFRDGMERVWCMKPYAAGGCGGFWFRKVIKPTSGVLPFG